MNKLLHFCLVLLQFLFLVDSARALDANFEKDTATANLMLGPADSVSVSVVTIERPQEFPYSKSYTWGGDDTTSPTRIIKKVIVLRNGQSLFIPLSAYADLGSPRRISLLKLSSHGFRLVVSGGDAAGSYDAILDFKKNEISRRRVVSGEFPKEVWEETTFSFNHLNN